MTFREITLAAALGVYALGVVIVAPVFRVSQEEAESAARRASLVMPLWAEPLLPALAEMARIAYPLVHGLLWPVLLVRDAVHWLASRIRRGS